MFTRSLGSVTRASWGKQLLSQQLLEHESNVIIPDAMFGIHPLFYQSNGIRSKRHGLVRAKLHSLFRVQKTLFLGSFGPNLPKTIFSKIDLCHILGITILLHCAKNQKKLMSQSREKLVRQTNEWTNERKDRQAWVDLKDLQVGPKISSKQTLRLGNMLVIRSSTFWTEGPLYTKFEGKGKIFLTLMMQV